MGAMFYLLSMVLYIKGRLSSGRTRVFCFGGLMLSYLLGVFSKENIAILPLFIVLYEFYFFQHFDLSPKGKKVVFILVGILLILGAFGVIIWGEDISMRSSKGIERAVLRWKESADPV